MSKLVVLEIVGEFEQGFSASLKIWREAVDPSNTHYLLSPIAGDKGTLPPAPQLLSDYHHWRSRYRNLEAFLPTRALRRRPHFTHASDKDKAFSECRKAANQLEQQFNHWLNSQDFIPLKHLWLESLNPSESIRLLLQTDNIGLRRLPWNQWELLQNSYTKTDVALSSPKFKSISVTQPSKEKVKILAILGDEVESQRDIEAIHHLPNCEVTCLEKPSRETLSKPLWEQSWDILFFAGHSYTLKEGELGAIKINAQDWLTMAELRNHLRKAIELGLRLAIFNSCDGLGLAYQLAEGEGLYLPQVIVMREQLPVQVAPKFLRYFLEAFTQGKLLHLALNEARQQLYLLERDFPCASWLPVICQNPTVVPPTWQTLCPQPQTQSPAQSFWSTVGQAGGASLVSVGVIMGLQWLGVLDMAELKAYDQLLRARPYESIDQRLLVIQVTPDDIKQYQPQNRQGVSLSDTTLAQLLGKLKQYEPSVIGLDLYRDYPVAEKTTELVSYLNQKQLFGICKVTAPHGGDPEGVAPPPEIPLTNLGFSDAIVDGDRILRRHLLSLKPETPTDACPAKNNLSLLLAFQYLENQGVLQWDYTANKAIKLSVPNSKKTVILSELTPQSTGYRSDDTGGRQIMLNYRSRPSPLEIAQTVTVDDVLSDRIPPHKIQELRNRIILIGVAGPRATNSDYWLTPYSAAQSPNNEKISGVMIQAHMVSQLVSAVLDERPLIQAWPVWGELLWIWGWSMVGGLISVFWRSPLKFIIAFTIAIATLSGWRYWLFLQGIWSPLVPAAIALVLTSIILTIRRNPSSMKKNSSHLSRKS